MAEQQTASPLLLDRWKQVLAERIRTNFDQHLLGCIGYPNILPIPSVAIVTSQGYWLAWMAEQKLELLSGYSWLEDPSQLTAMATIEFIRQDLVTCLQRCDVAMLIGGQKLKDIVQSVRGLASLALILLEDIVACSSRTETTRPG
jgi:hypothetical protein